MEKDKGSFVTDDTTPHQTDFTVMHLRPGDSLMIQQRDTIGAAQHTVHFIGNHRDLSFLTSLPESGAKGILIRTDVSFDFRVLHGKYAYGFTTRLMLAQSRPYPHAHFALPEAVQFRQVRRANRLHTMLPVEIMRADGTHSLAIMLDLGQYGALLELSGLLDELGKECQLTLPIILPDLSRKITTVATIRNTGDAEKSLAAGRFRYGVSFGELPAEEASLLRQFIDHLLAEQDGLD